MEPASDQLHAAESGRVLLQVPLTWQHTFDHLLAQLKDPWHLLDIEQASHAQ